MADDEKPNRFAAKVKQAETPGVKQLRIKVGSLKRTTKDLRFAKKEVAQEEARMETIKATDPDRAPQQENVIKEAKMMVPDSQNRIRSAIKDLCDYLEKEKADIADEELLAEAEAAVKDAEAALQEE